MEARPEPLELPVAGTAPATRRRDALRNGERILAAAEKLFAADGIESVSMDRVAAEAGVGKGTLFRHFGDRAGLARALLSEHEARFQDELIRGAPPLGPGAPPRERLVAFGEGVIDLIDAHAPILITAEKPGPDPGSGPYAFHRTHVAMLIREADPSLDADHLADALLAMLSARLHVCYREAVGLDLDRIKAGWREVVERLLP